VVDRGGEVLIVVSECWKPFKVESLCEQVVRVGGHEARGRSVWAREKSDWREESGLTSGRTRLSRNRHDSTGG